jgi:hypothetical protein
MKENKSSCRGISEQGLGPRLTFAISVTRYGCLGTRLLLQGTACWRRSGGNVANEPEKAAPQEWQVAAKARRSGAEPRPSRATIECSRHSGRSAQPWISDMASTQSFLSKVIAASLQHNRNKRHTLDEGSTNAIN